MPTLKAVIAALAKKQADLDMMDDQLMGMPEMAPDAPMDMPMSPEFDLLSDKREQLEEEIRKMREGVELISQWEKFKGGNWSEEVKNLLGEIDIEISDIAGGEVAPADAMGGMPPADMAAPVDLAAPAAPAPDMGAEPPAAVAPALDPTAPAAPVAEAEPTEPAPLEPPMASADASKTPVSKKNSYQSPDKKGVLARSDSNKEGSNMANPTPAKASVQEKLAEVKSKREAIKREAQQRVAAAWTIAKTMLPSAPADIQKSAAANLLQNPTNVLNAMLRQTAKNAHASKLAETFKQVHKTELNEFLTEGEDLNSLKASVEKELKGDPKSAAAKVADDRKDAGPQTETYNDGRGAGGGKHTEPKEMDAGSASSQTEAEHRPENTINKSEGDGKVATKAAAAAAPKTAKCECDGECKCASKDEEKKEATVKTADPVMDAPPMEEAAPAGDMGAPVEEAPMDMAPEAPEEMPLDEGAEGDTSGEVLSDEKKMVVEEKIEEAQEAIKALEQEILQEGEEELDLAQVFNEEDMEDKVSSLANEGDDKTAGNGEEYFAPTSAESMEASLDEPQMASMEDFFSLQGSDSDPLAHLIAGEIRTAADVAGFDVVESSTGEAANHFESDTATGEGRDSENDHEGDLFADAIEDQTAEDGGFKRVKQDETNEMQAPKSAKGKKPVINKLKAVTASESKKVDIASALLGDDEF